MAGGGEQSMLDVVLKQMKEENRDQVIHCTTLVSRLSTTVNDKRDVGKYYELLFQQCQQLYQGEGPTGMLLIYPEYVVHMIEGCWELVEAVIRDLCESSSSGLLIDTRILHFSTNVAPRLYSQWAYRVLSLPTLSKGEVYQTTETIAQTVSSALNSLYKLGAHLTQHHHEVKGILDNISLQQEFLLPQDLLEYLIMCTDLDTPTQFIARYCSPSHVVLDSELVWPLPTRLFPYDD